MRASSWLERGADAERKIVKVRDTDIRHCIVHKTRPNEDARHGQEEIRGEVKHIWLGTV